MMGIIICTCLNKNLRIPIKISLKIVPKVPINNIQVLVQIVAWCPPGDKPSSEPLMVRLSTHICVIRHQWVNSFQWKHVVYLLIFFRVTSLELDSRVIATNAREITEGHARWRHQMGTFSALLALCEGNSPITGEFPSQRPVTRSFYAFFDPRLNKRLSKPSRRRMIWDAMALIMTSL